MDVNRILTCCVTLDHQPSSQPLKAMSVKNATDIKQHLALLEHERVLALDTALRDDPRYMADLEEEILATRHAYVGSAVIEIAHLRAALGGENWGWPPPANVRAMSARAWAAFATVSTLWGIPYLFIKIAVDDGVPPAFLAFVRVALGAAVLMALAWRAGALGALRGRGRWLALYALFEIVVPFPLIAAGERHVASSLAAIIIAAVPLFVALLALRFDRAERATGSRLVGLIMGLAGVVALVGIDVAGAPSELLGAAAVGVAAFGYAVGPMVFKRKLVDLDPRAAMGVSLAVASLMLAPAAAIAPPAARPSASALLSIGVLGLLCTAAAFVFMAVLVADVGPG